MDTLKTILSETRKELMRKDKVRETTYTDLRKTMSLSKQAILLVHQKRLKEARKLIEKARRTISRVNNISATHPSIIYSGLYSDAMQEYSEANIFLKLIQESRFITPKEIDAPSDDYVLGLADVIGELRRAALDALREGDTKKGEQHLQTMDQIYIELMAMDESYMLVSGLRRKCDVARKIIEITRGDVTQEIRRNELEKHLKQFEKHAKNRKRTQRCDQKKHG
jgi:translin